MTKMLLSLPSIFIFFYFFKDFSNCIFLKMCGERVGKNFKFGHLKMYYIHIKVFVCSTIFNYKKVLHFFSLPLLGPQFSNHILILYFQLISINCLSKYSIRANIC